MTADIADHELIASRLDNILGEALSLLVKQAQPAPLIDLAPEMAPSLLQQCLDMCGDHASSGVEPVRTVHHFACTGGTLISRCIAALPNVQLLSEVDPLSVLMLSDAKHPFMPTDMIGLARRSTRGVDEAMLSQMFRASIDLLHADTVRRGLRLVLRDHAHSHFCIGSRVADRPTLRELLPTELPVRSLVTVRHPVDSFASLVSNGWAAFAPPTFEEYAKRYIAFLDRYSGVPIVRYEDLVAEPGLAMVRVCEALDIPMREGYSDYIGLFALSGDSGRSGDWISARPRRPEVTEILAAAAESDDVQSLCRRLAYAL